ncbi:hypothetical protein WMY93_020724 [Mugilogobius chulae]|uniref:Uncharacterized protein n=1 Tax=Mugilogobius chulae TaxID=88201 RepID=A0AAW0NIP8_9GOBI
MTPRRALTPQCQSGASCTRSSSVMLQSVEALRSDSRSASHSHIQTCLSLRHSDRMSSSLPKSESTTSLLRSHSRGAAGGKECAARAEESETSAMRPLCQPRNTGAPRGQRTDDKKERSKTSRSKHQSSSPQQQGRKSSPSAQAKHKDDAAFLFEPSRREQRLPRGSCSSISSTDPPTASAPARHPAHGRPGRGSAPRSQSTTPLSIPSSSLCLGR